MKLSLNKKKRNNLEKIIKQKNITMSQLINLMLEQGLKGMIENE